MADTYPRVKTRRAIIDRRAVADALAMCMADRATATEILRRTYEDGVAELNARIDADPGKGLAHANSRSFLTDQLIRLIYDFATQRLYPNSNPTAAERLAVCAVGGYGRREMAPFSDVDLLFLTPGKLTAWSEQIIEAILYTLWDLGWKVGHATRSLDEMVRLSREDVTIRTAMLEARYLWGDQYLYDSAASKFTAEVTHGTERDFIQQKLAERDTRHERMGDSRYVVEPNVKEAKGGLRDLHTLFWIGKYTYRVDRAAELVDRGLFEPEEYRQFNRAENFLWSVRTLLHRLSNRAEDRLTFDMQRELAARLGYQERAGSAPVERFMRHYFLIAKSVGDLTGLFLAHVEEQHAAARLRLPSITRAPRRLKGFTVRDGRLGIPTENFFQERPLRLMRLFALADQYGYEIHPLAMRQARRDAQLAADLQEDEKANALFMQVLTSPRDPALVLRWMNEAGVFGRFMPDFGRVVARMQYDMYHHYTVDEHTIRAIGLLSKIEKGELAGDHPVATSLIHKIASREVLYVAVLLHDIAKGRGGDHSEVGAEVAEQLCPRMGMTSAQTETVAWLVRWHLLMSATAFKRDLSDPKTIEDFVVRVQSPERLKLLLILTAVDIRAVGPGTWTPWKGQLLTTLFEAAEARLRLGHQEHGRQNQIDAKQAAVADDLGWDKAHMSRYAARFSDSYWVAEPLATLAANARQIDTGERELSVATTVDPETGLTHVTTYASDHPGIFMRLAGAISLSGANILDARVHTTRDGMALDNIGITAPLGEPFNDPGQLTRLRQNICDTLEGRIRLRERLAKRPLAMTRADSFPVQTRVLVQPNASNRFTVVEVNAADRPGLLYALARALFDAKLTIRSAHIMTFGERAVDTFYLTDLMGHKLDSVQRLRGLERRLLNAAKVAEEERKAA
ncbi:[protein-PII] uridylyltransferase [Pacificimonas sp. WHA3]|uniref:Bifunctional uridylyltransferase/uridylyl-removing enzyme n=1 Tax=Pacificimonas pallii TaxID=2827236 RepID=A0ABS6SGL5_9SPHN|nr:[protein-PII] uridylyltransferase [Pacificimonas pallii]MBV7257400.1 [protein-PII] uridylyltransferase [Pacificimonas pallii]